MLRELRIGDMVAKLPIIQGGMGVGVSLSRLAGAVAKEGGVGVISTAQIGFEEPEFEKDQAKANLIAIKKHIKKAKELACGQTIGTHPAPRAEACALRGRRIQPDRKAETGHRRARGVLLPGYV